MTPRTDAPVSAVAIHPLYRQLDEEINSRLGIDLGFTALIRASPYPLEAAALAGFRKRHAVIQRFQQRTLDLFKASLRGEADPEVAAMVLGDVPPHLGRAYHEQLTERQHQVPVFFRTDEPAPGKLAEIQCPGSGWCLAEELLTLYRHNPSVFGPPRHFQASLATAFAQTLRHFLGRAPAVHHLLDNASRPHGMRYFIQRTREAGVKYFSYDRDVAAADCNFVRSHDFITLPHHNFFVDRMQRCEQGQVRFDLSPSALFDGKLIQAWPFWERTCDAYDAEIRGLFPFTSVVRPGGVELPDGRRLGLADFFRLKRADRDYFLKYAGSDIALNWGSKSVFLASSLSQAQGSALADTIVAHSRQGRCWILQEAHAHREQVDVFCRSGETREMTAYSKFSGFYGPDGLMAVLVMQKPFHKVHGGADTIMSMVV